MGETAIGITFNADKTKVLLIKRRDIPVWVLPGGGIEEGESPETAVVREVLEETGVNVSIVRKVAEYSSTNSFTNLTHIFECKQENGSPEISPEARDVGFHSPEATPGVMFIIHKDWIDDALRNALEVIKRPHHGITYWRAILYLLRHPVLGIRYLIAKAGFPLNS